MVRLHRLSSNVYGVTGLFHLSKVDVNAGFVARANLWQRRNSKEHRLFGKPSKSEMTSRISIIVFVYCS